MQEKKSTNSSMILAIIIIAIILGAVFIGTQNASGEFVGSKNSDVYHYPSCSYAQRIKAENRIVFSSAQDARNHGYRPCKVCNPP